MEEVQKEVQNISEEVQTQDLYLTIYLKIKEGKRPSKIAKELNLGKTNIQYYVNALKSQGIIKKVGYGVWEVQKEVQSFSLGTRPTTNVHALQINFPILEGKIEDSDWEIKERLKNWIPKYKGLDNLGGLTLKNNNNQSITVFAKSRDLQSMDLSEIDNLAFKIRAFVFEYFKNKHKVILDVMNCQTKNLNLATQDKTSEGMIRKGEKFELDLNKKAEKIFPKDNMDAKAWVDGSPFKFSAETNDKEWKRSYLQMPFAVGNLVSSLPAIQEYNKNILLHMEVQKEQLKTQKEIQTLLDKLQNILGGQK